MSDVILTSAPILIEECLKRLSSHPCCGALVSFAGIVRDHNDGKEVCGIEYECFESMAQRELGQIVEEARRRWDIHQIQVVHRTGDLNVGETSLLVVASAPHRQEAFAAVEFLIDELKHRVPIWKKEKYVSGKTTWLA